MANCLTSTGLIALLIAILFGGLFLADDTEPENITPTLHPVVVTALPTDEPVNLSDLNATTTAFIQNFTETAAAYMTATDDDVPPTLSGAQLTATLIIWGATQTAAAGTLPPTYDPDNPPDYEATATAIIQVATQTAVQLTPNN